MVRSLRPLLDGDIYNCGVRYGTGFSGDAHITFARGHGYHGSGCGWLVEGVAAILCFDLVDTH
jgi:hypothetical protein